MANTHVLVLDRASDQHAEIASTSWLPSGDHTIFWRMKLASLPGVGEEYTIISRKIAAGGVHAYLIHVAPPSYIHASIRRADGGESSVHWGNVEIPLGLWVTCAVTCDISEATATERELFVDGVSRGNGTVDTSSNVTAIATGAGELNLGYNTKIASQGFDGKLDEVLFFNTILSQPQIAAMQNVETDPGAADLYCGWWLNNDLLDGVASFDLTGVNSPTFDATDLPDFVVKHPRAISVTPSAGGIGFGI